MATASKRTRMSTLQGIATSPKVHRWLPWLAAAVLIAGVVAVLVAYFGNTVPANPNEKTSNAPAQKETPLGKAIHLPAAARTTAAQFIDAGVRGKNPTVAWKLSGPEIRQGESLKQWLHDWKTTGVPITPYPATKGAQMLIDFSRQKEIQLKFALLPKKGSGYQPQMFLMVLDRYGKRWLVNSWQSFAPPAIPSP
jgi:hypothetical protein